MGLEIGKFSKKQNYIQKSKSWKPSNLAHTWSGRLQSRSAQDYVDANQEHCIEIIGQWPEVHRQTLGCTQVRVQKLP